jgi:hypothetical protein
MEAVVKVEEVFKHETRGGNIRYVLRDDQAHEYVTFRPQIGEEARGLTGKTARIEFHEEQRGEYKNVYLDAIAPTEPPEAGGEALEADEVAWQAAAAAAPWLVGEQRSPDEVFEKLKALKDRVADDIKRTSKK